MTEKPRYAVLEPLTHVLRLTSVRSYQEVTPLCFVKRLAEEVHALAVRRVSTKAPHVEDGHVFDVITVDVVVFDQDCGATDLLKVGGQVRQLNRGPDILDPSQEEPERGG